jgi:adenylate cyclase
MLMPSPIEIFFSYSHKDKRLRDELETQLSLLKRQGAITAWYDRKIGAGKEWANEIDTHLNSAQIILLLVSPDYLASDYCYDIEMKLALERHEAKEAYVIPVILRSVDWKEAPFGSLRALPTDAKPVTEWSNRDRAFEDIAKGIRNIIEGLFTILSTDATHRETMHQEPLSIPLGYIPPCPYRGLSAFQKQDAPYFFGRDVFIEQLMDSVQNKPLIAVIGPSGSGKSSLVFAGIIPRLDRDSKWCITSFRPRDRPFRALAAALTPLLETHMSETDLLVQIKKLSEQIHLKELSLFDIAEHIMEKNSAVRFLLFVDQFEELYTLSRNADARQRFLDILLEAVHVASQQQTLNFTLVLTLRADFLGQVLLYRPFADALQHADLKLSSMNRLELQDAIKKPAEQVNVRIEDGLTERILDAVSQEPGNLPLLEFTLTQLWNTQRRNTLTHDAYDEIGGVEQSLATYAENFYTKLDENEQQQARRIFIQLVYPGKGTEDTRRIATRVQLGEEGWNLVVRLSDARLVVSGRDELTGEETVEVVHEALIRGWNRLRNWMDEDREFRLWQERLRARMSEWERANYSHSELLRGVMLAESESWLAERGTELSQAEREFIQASRKQMQEEQHWKEQYEIAEQSRLEAVQKRNELEALYEIARTLNSTLEFDKSLRLVMEEVINLVKAERGFLVLLNPDTQKLEFKIARDKRQKSIDYSEFNLSRSIIERVIRTREPLLTDDAQMDDALTTQESIMAFGIRSIMCAPLVVRDHCIGAVYVDSRINANLFSAKHRDLLLAFCHQAAIAIDNARLFADLSKALRTVEEDKQYMDTILASIANGVITTDSSGIITKFNDAAGMILRINPLSVVGKHYQDVFGALPQLGVIELLQNAHMQQSHDIIVPDIVECEIAGRGQINLTFYVSSLRENPQTAPIGMALVIDDRTELKRAEAKAKDIRRIFGRFVHPNVVQLLIENPNALNLGGETKEITVIAADFRGFTSLSERKSSKEVVNLLNTYLEIMVKEIWDEGGTVTEFGGDTLMAIFNAPLPQKDHVLRAVRAAWKTRLAILEYQRTQTQETYFSFGIGVNTGEAIVGNIGSRDRIQNYTAIGDVVNVAVGLQSGGRDNNILLNHSTFSRIRQYVRVTKLPPLSVKNKAEPLDVWCLIGWL